KPRQFDLAVNLDARADACITLVDGQSRRCVKKERRAVGRVTNAVCRKAEGDDRNIGMSGIANRTAEPKLHEAVSLARLAKRTRNEQRRRLIGRLNALLVREDVDGPDPGKQDGNDLNELAGGRQTARFSTPSEHQRLACYFSSGRSSVLP